ncbi:MAG: hypothetical protein JEZ08_25580 [Clostridiales bacterium]|nr:hypothetical protein [Clostridiales bacterium]
MGNNISAETLFHFMQEFDYLKQALEKQFSPRYYKEDVRPFFGKAVYIAVKCFCDIPLSLVTEHSKTYGKYSIGLKKEWGIKANLNPVTYFNKDSDYIDSIRESYNSNIDIINDENFNSGDRILFDLGVTMRLMQRSFLNFKPLKGRMWREGKWKYNVDFYNEREWRYISKFKNWVSSEDGLISYKQFLLEEDLHNQEIEKFNIALSEVEKVEFDYDDINFIIVETDEENN